MDKLTSIFKNNWKAIIFSYVLFSIQSFCMVIYPKVLGDSIDHLIKKDYMYMVNLLLIFVGMMFFGYISNIYDTIVFSKIKRRFASIETHKQIENNVDTSKINGRLNLMNGIVHFFEQDVLLVLQAIFGLCGSIYFISLVDSTMVLYLVLSGVLTLIVTAYFMPKIAEVTEESNNLAEEQTDVINTRKINIINNLLRMIQKLAVKTSNISARFSIAIQFIAYGTITGLLTYYVVFNTVTVGSAFSTYKYLFDFCTSVTIIPSVISSFINIKDVIKRLENEEE